MKIVGLVLLSFLGILPQAQGAANSAQYGSDIVLSGRVERLSRTDNDNKGFIAWRLNLGSEITTYPSQPLGGLIYKTDHVQIYFENSDPDFAAMNSVLQKYFDAKTVIQVFGRLGFWNNDHHAEPVVLAVDGAGSIAGVPRLRPASTLAHLGDSIIANGVLIKRPAGWRLKLNESVLILPSKDSRAHFISEFEIKNTNEALLPRLKSWALSKTLVIVQGQLAQQESSTWLITSSDSDIYEFK